jgi:inner membrane protein
MSGGTIETGLFRTGLRAALPTLENLPANSELPFDVTLELNGTRDLRVLPSAEETDVSIASSWPHPSFTGSPLPETRRISAGGFDAQWRVQDFGRPYSARWTTSTMNQEQLAAAAASSAFGVSLVQPVDIYQQCERAVKYAALFIVLTFLVFFMWELYSATLLHPMQYTFVGFAMCIFYLLLISISEHTGFDRAYAVSSSATIVLIGGYARAALRGSTQALSVFAALSTLYGFLFLLLRAEDYALLAGSIGLFLILAVVMFVTRRTNWYDIRLGATSHDTPA